MTAAEPCEHLWADMTSLSGAMPIHQVCGSCGERRRLALDLTLHRCPGAKLPARTRTRPDLCAEHGHPGVTHNAQLGRTWCLCGEVIRDGDQVTLPHASCCGGPLEETIHDADCPEAVR